MTRNGVSLALFSVGDMSHRTLLLRLSAVLRNAVVMCSPLITPDNCWHNTTWPEFQPSLPPGHAGELNSNAKTAQSEQKAWSNGKSALFVRIPAPWGASLSIYLAEFSGFARLRPSRVD